LQISLVEQEEDEETLIIYEENATNKKNTGSTGKNHSLRYGNNKKLP
jgi:hypothetical protein